MLHLTDEVVIGAGGYTQLYSVIPLASIQYGRVLAVVANRVHTPEVVGSNPTSAISRRAQSAIIILVLKTSIFSALTITGNKSKGVKEPLIIIPKSDALALHKEYAVPYGYGGISHTSSNVGTYYLCESKKNMKLLNELRNSKNK